MIRSAPNLILNVTQPSHRGLSVLSAILAAVAVFISTGSLVAEGPEKDNATTTDKKPADKQQLGKQIYATKCASCHGGAGEGVMDEYPDALTGDSSIGELAEVISDTMPEEDPDECTAENAEAVAAYIHQAFYSKAAQIRNRPPRVRLARLTSNQLRQSLADLYARFEGVGDVTDKHGTEATYFNGTRWKNENKKIERVDPVIDFDFGDKGPGSGINPKDFMIYWDGGIRAEVTGRYEIIVRSTCSFTMDFGANDRQLFDNHVQSGDKTEFRSSLALTGGRVYPFEIQFVQRKRKTAQPPAKFSVSWIPPGGIEEIIPARNYIDGWAPSTFALQTKLPPDDRSYGYERGISVDRQWDESVTAAALEFGDVAVEEMWPRYKRKHRKDSDENRGRLRTFLTGLVETAFRTTLDEETRQLYIDKQLAATPDDALAVKRVCLLALKSPRFLYPLADESQSPSQRAANRLALTLHDSLPADNRLVSDASKGKLKNEEQIRRAAYRMLHDYRTRGKTLEMLHGWLNLSHIQDMSKNAEKFPGFDETIVSDLRKSLDAMLEEIAWSESSDYRQLFLADWTYTTDRLAGFYGPDWKPAEESHGGLGGSDRAPEHHLGVLTHPLMMSGLAYNTETSPIHRGVFLIRFVLGRTLRPPNEAFAPISPDLHPDLTTRQRVDLQTSAESCQICHSKINALGFALENFDAVGKYRTEEHGKPVEATGSYMQQSGQEVSFSGARELATYLADSQDAKEAFIERAFQHFVKQPVAAFGPDTMQRLMTNFEENNHSIKELLVEIAVIAATPPIPETSKPDTSQPASAKPDQTASAGR